MSRISSDRTTDGIRVIARPAYLPEQSDPELGHFVFSYTIRIENHGSRAVMLVSRHWEIIDTDGNREVVEGLGVVGQQPVLEPGEAHEYTSFCPLGSDFGTMEGWFRMVDEDGRSFDAAVGRFYLASGAPAEA
jgi:ApaG protein